MDFEATVLAASGAELDVGEEWIVLVEHAVSGEMDDLLVGSQGSEGGFGRTSADQNARAIAMDSSDGSDLVCRTGQMHGPWCQRQHATPRRHCGAGAQP